MRKTYYYTWAKSSVLYVCHPVGNRPRYGRVSTRLPLVEWTVPYWMTKNAR